MSRPQSRDGSVTCRRLRLSSRSLPLDLLESPFLPVAMPIMAVAAREVPRIGAVGEAIGSVKARRHHDRRRIVLVDDRRRCVRVHPLDWPRTVLARCTTILGFAFIRRFHSLMYSRMKASSVAGAVTPCSSVFTRPGTPKPRCI